MDHFESAAYTDIERQLDELITQSGLEISSWDEIGCSPEETPSSSLDAWDYCFAIANGLISPFISTNEQLQDYLKEIHNAASEATGDYDFLQTLLGNLLHHKGDPIDKVERNFIKRDRENAWVLFHRLLWGHDIFSNKEDNPFYLMIKKQGLSGIIQATQHLLADTTSKQGLPVPGSSYLDFIDEDGSLSNYLIKISQRLSIDTTGSKRAAQEIYSHMFTVRAADMLGASSTAVLNKAYFGIRAIQDDIRKQQFNLIAYNIYFWSQVIMGVVKTGVPFINIPVGAAMVKSFISLRSKSISNTRDILRKGSLLEKETDRLIALAEDDLGTHEIPPCQHESAEEALTQEQNNALFLMRIWGGGTG